ncbi:MAG: hypothetical protein ACOYL2_12420 [Burkholderiaceae bacterium]|jgi:hypothetical protein
MRSVYLRYLALVKKVNNAESYPYVIDESAKRLLEVIALSYAQNRPLTVSAAIALTPIASPHTPHRKLGLLHKLRQIYGQMFFDRKN